MIDNPPRNRSIAPKLRRHQGRGCGVVRGRGVGVARPGVPVGVDVGVTVAVAVGVAVGVGVGVAPAGAAARPDNCVMLVLNKKTLVPVTGSIV